MSEAAKLREQLWYGVPFKQALRDQVSRSMTGYPYDELKSIIESEDDEEMLEPEDLASVDRLVNILLHMFVFYHSYQTEDAA